MLLFCSTTIYLLGVIVLQLLIRDGYIRSFASEEENKTASTDVENHVKDDSIQNDNIRQ